MSLLNWLLSIFKKNPNPVNYSYPDRPVPLSRQDPEPVASIVEEDEPVDTSCPTSAFRLFGSSLIEATGCSEQAASRWSPHLDNAMVEFGIDSPLRAAAFIAQIAHESSNFTRFTENLNYSANRLMQVWPRRFKTLEVAKQYAGNPSKLANNVYASRMGNGNEASGDGWKYRGRGIVQLTGKANYRAAGKALKVDLLNYPDYAKDDVVAARVAAWFWAGKGCNELADQEDFVAITKKINGGTIGLAHRQELYERAKIAFS